MHAQAMRIDGVGHEAGTDTDTERLKVQEMLMAALYLVATWIHILTFAVWFGAMLFEDPQSDRFFCRLIKRMHGVGWYAQAVLWSTGLFMLNYRGISPGRLFSSDFVASSWGRAMWVKIALVLTLGVFQATVGHQPSKLIFGYVIVAFLIAGISVLLVRPVIL
jgi:hypothetical protein